MRELVGVAERVRLARAAAQRFFWRGHLEQVVICSEVLDRVAADVERARRDGPYAGERTAGGPRALRDTEFDGPLQSRRQPDDGR